MYVLFSSSTCEQPHQHLSHLSRRSKSGHNPPPSKNSLCRNWSARKSCFLEQPRPLYAQDPFNRKLPFWTPFLLNKSSNWSNMTCSWSCSPRSFAFISFQRPFVHFRWGRWCLCYPGVLMHIRLVWKQDTSTQRWWYNPSRMSDVKAGEAKNIWEFLQLLKMMSAVRL